MNIKKAKPIKAWGLKWKEPFYPPYKNLLKTVFFTKREAIAFASPHCNVVRVEIKELSE